MEKRIKRKKKTADLRSGDFPLVMITTILVLFGLIMVFSASYYYSISQAGNPYSYLIKHGMWVVFGFVVMVFGASFDYRRYKKAAIPGLIISFVLLVLLFTPLGQTVNGATRWIGAGPVTIMPGELAKLAVILFTAWFLSKDTGRIKSVLHGILPLVVIAGVFGVLIMKQPNLSTAITVCGIIVSMMLVAGMKWRYCIGAVGAGALGIVAILVTKSGHWYSRLTSFTDPFADPLGDGYQVVQSLLALGSGGLFGVGLGKSVQKNLYLPEPQNDFIAAIIGEELGFVGLMLLLVVYCLFIWRGVRYSDKCSGSVRYAAGIGYRAHGGYTGYPQYRCCHVIHACDRNKSAVYKLRRQRSADVHVFSRCADQYIKTRNQKYRSRIK